MGVCESCLRQQEDEERKPLLREEVIQLPQKVSVPKEEDTKKDWHQSVIDEANLHFIILWHSDNRHRQRMKQTPEDIRYKLSSSTLDLSLMTTVGTRSLDSETCFKSGTVSSQDVVNILSEPVLVSDRLDAGLDEITHILNTCIRGEDRLKNGRDGGSLVSHLKPVNLPN